MNVLVTGGTGTLGRHVVMLLRQSGHRARILSREPRGHVDAVQGDLKSGTGLGKAVMGMGGIVHAATGARESMASRAADHRTKFRAEAIVREDLVPWSILRATQFHDLIEIVLGGFTRLPGVAAIPFRWQFQPVDTREVAQRVVDVVLQEPAGMLPDFGGPEVRDFESIAESWLKARKRNRRLINLKLPFRFSRQFAEGILTCPDHKDGKITFDQYLQEKYAP
ncbi:MAG: SDR family oxidoreductase [Chloroflexi bacterium]|nr:MAG: SDR family oxidoreductase [Chloroflexota bacterium]